VATHAHNLIMQLLAETGLAGALLITGGAMLWLWDLRRHIFDPEHWWLLALLATIGIHSMLEFPLWHAYFLGVAAIALGLGATRFYALRLQRTGPAAAALLLLAGFFNAFTVWYGYRDFERMFVQGAKPFPGEEVAAIVLRGQQDPVLEPYVELAASAYARVDREQLQDKLELNGRVMRFMPADIVVYRQALLLAMDGQAEAARGLFVRAMRVYPDILPRITAMLRELAARHPAEFAPLLELATAKAAAQRAPHAVKNRGDS
ncbi:MAG: Wzy polymerase domain-containing protein, partial [Burkholderiales bacterium]|nr:Wzy polymerase domain-containing protein [Burkholderiales bacterium]